VAGTLAYLFHQLYHVACPRCGLETRTLQDRPRSAMVAICDRCRVTWDLGVRIGTGQ
jgi:NMD protein affecting ribosome stability and mRNA decay